MNLNEESTEAIAAALHPFVGDAVREGRALVTHFPVPGLREGSVWRVRLEDLEHPQQAYVGLWPDGSARVLSDDLAAFMDLVAAAGVEIADPETALGYVQALLEVTRGPMVIVRPLTSVADIRWRPGSDEEERRKAEFLSQASVRPPLAEPSGDGFHVELFLVVDQRVQLNSFDVARHGSVSASYRVIAKDLPLPIAR